MPWGILQLVPRHLVSYAPLRLIADPLPPLFWPSALLPLPSPLLPKVSGAACNPALTSSWIRERRMEELVGGYPPIPHA